MAPASPNSPHTSVRSASRPPPPLLPTTPQSRLPYVAIFSIFANLRARAKRERGRRQKFARQGRAPWAAGYQNAACMHERAAPRSHAHGERTSMHERRRVLRGGVARATYSHSRLQSGQTERVFSQREMQSRWKTWPQQPHAIE